MQPEQDGFLIALPERLAEGGGLLQCLRGKRQLGPVLTRGFRRQDGLQQLKKPFDLVQLGKTAGYAPVVAERRDGAPDIAHAQRRAAQAGQQRGTGAWMRTDPDVIAPPAKDTPALEQRGQAIVPGDAALVVLIDGMKGRMGLEQGGKPPAHVKINLRTGKRVRQRLDQRQRQYRIPQKSRIPYRDPLHKAPPFGQTASPIRETPQFLFRNGTLQMAFCWNIAQQLNSDNNDAGLTNSGDEIFPMAFPTESGDPKLCGGIWGFGIFDNGDEAKIEAAKTFIDFIAADPDQVGASVLASTYFPVRESVGDIYAGNDIMSEYTKFMGFLGDYYQITPGWATARTEWWNMLQRVGTGEPVEQAVATFVENANAAATAEA